MEKGVSHQGLWLVCFQHSPQGWSIAGEERVFEDKQVLVAASAQSDYSSLRHATL